MNAYAAEPRGDGETTTHAIIGAAMAVANYLGHGFLEAVYRRAMLVELRCRRLLVEEEVPYKLTYRGQPIGVYVADLIVEKSVLVELKAADSLKTAHHAQVLNYLKASGLHVGLLINFGTPRISWQRIAHSGATRDP